MDRDDEVQTRENGRKAGDENAERRRDDIRRRGDRAEWGVEGPARVDAAGDEGVEREEAAEDVDVPAREVQFRERKVLRADHDRDEKVAEHGRNDGNQEKEHHHHAVHREELVVRLIGDEVTGRRGQIEPDQHGERASNEEKHGHRGQVQQRDALVIAGQQPRLDAVALVQIVMRWTQQRRHVYLASTWGRVLSALTYSMSSRSPSSLT